MHLVTLPRQMVVNINGVPRVGAKLYVYDAGTTTPRAAYTTAALLVLHTNPILSVSSAFFPAAYVDSADGPYKLVITDALDVTVWSEDDIPATELTADLVAALLNHQTDAEEALGIVPSDFFAPTYNLLRYGADPTGVAESSTAWAKAVSLGRVIIPEGTFKITSGATHTGQIRITGEGRKSILRCDTTILTVTDGPNSTVENFYMENLTAPWIITRDPASWLAAKATLDATLAQSNGLGYQPTLNDFYWNGAAQVDYYSTLTTAQKTQNIGPQIAFYGSGAGVDINRIFGRFVSLYINGYTDCTVHDCEFRAGKAVFGGIQIDNYSNSSAVGTNNRVFNNRVSYASFSGADFWNNQDGECTDNRFFRCGESGIRMHAADGTPGLPYNYRMKISGNHCYENYYDGLDMMAQYPTPDDVPETHHQVSDNYLYRNGGTGINCDGRYNSYTGNHVYKNGRYGFWNYASYSKFSGNYFLDNNQERNNNWHELLFAGATGYNQADDNFFLGGAGENGKAIFCFTNVPNFIGDNPAVGLDHYLGDAGTSVQVLSPTNDSTRGLATDQSFTFILTNNGGTLQHSIRGADANTAALTLGITRVSSASATPANTPTAIDSGTAMASGGKISATNTNYFIFDTAAQVAAFADLDAVIASNSSGTVILVNPILVSSNVNGVTRLRLVFAFENASSGAAFALTTGNIAAGKTIVVKFRGRLS
jgi:hypothetical protein